VKKNGLFGELIGEVFGTFILILLGDGIVANVGLAPALLLVARTGTPLRSAGLDSKLGIQKSIRCEEGVRRLPFPGVS
jgi:glycerol uptake facilitator-like aquaporin